MSFAARKNASRGRRRRRGRARRAKVSRARLVPPPHRSLSRLVARYSLHVLPNAPPSVSRGVPPRRALFGILLMSLLNSRIARDSRVSKEAGNVVPLSARDDGASIPDGTAANARLRQRARVRIYGTVIASVGPNKWRVEWDEPNYMANALGVKVTEEFYNKIRKEKPGAGRYVPSAAPARSRELSSSLFPGSETLTHPSFLNRAGLWSRILRCRRTTTTRTGTTTTRTTSAVPTPRTVGTRSSARLAVEKRTSCPTTITTTLMTSSTRKTTTPPRRRASSATRVAGGRRRRSSTGRLAKR